jgi:uncharacterized protein YdeI (YjbR/CyaY-like superfamily)
MPGGGPTGFCGVNSVDDWLRRIHASKQEVWVVFFKKTSPRTSLCYNDAVEEALCFGWIDGLRRSIDGHRYMHRFSPRKPDSKWSPSNIERVRRMIDVIDPLARCKKLGMR